MMSLTSEGELPEYDPNSKDSSDDPNFLGDNDHGDAIPAPKCFVCGVPWAGHMGVTGVCLWNKTLKEDLKDLREEIFQLTKERDDAQVDQRLIEMKEQINQLRKQRDAARREVCRLMSMFNAENSGEIAASRSWDCFKKEETQ